MRGLSLSREGALAVITVDRPEARNAIDRAAMKELEEIVAEIEADGSIACTILTGAGGSFIAGGDLKDLARIPEPEQGREMSFWMQGTVNRLDNLPCPTIAAIDGDAYGGGCELALACDIRVLREGATLHFRQTQMGLTPGWGGGQRLARLIGRAQAVLLYATAAQVGSAEALRLGIVERVAPDAMAEARAIGARIAERSPLAVRNTKRAIVEGAGLPLEQAIALETERFAETWGSPAHRAAVAAFLARSAKS